MKQPSWSIQSSLLNNQNQETLDDGQLKHLADLSSISLNDAKSGQLREDVKKILFFVGNDEINQSPSHTSGHIQQLKTENVKPLQSLLENHTLKLRDDIPKSDSLEEVTGNASLKHRIFLVVPKVRE